MTHPVPPFGWIAPKGGDPLMNGYDVISDLAAAIAATIRPEICVMRADVQTTLTHNVAKVLPLDVTEIATTAAMADLANDRVVIQKAGYYRIDVSMGTVFTATTGIRKVHATVNGTRVGRVGRTPAIVDAAGSVGPQTIVKTTAYAWLAVGALVQAVGTFWQTGGTGATTTQTSPGDAVNNEDSVTLSVALLAGAVPAVLP